jgi:ureidoglycolate lyase
MAPPRTLVARALDAAGFAPFGEVIDTGATDGVPVNNGTSVRVDFDARIAPGPDGATALRVFDCRTPAALPIEVRRLERHPLASQAFVPLEPTRFLVVVAAPAEVPGALAAFVTDGRQGVNYAPGTWHLPLAALTPGRFLVVDRAGEDDNCDVADLAQPVRIEIG